MKLLDPNRFSGKQFAHSRGQLAYVACGTRKDVSFAVAQLSGIPAERATPHEAKELNKHISVVKENVPFVIPKLDSNSLQIVGCADADFANNNDAASQLGIAILLKDKGANASLIHYASRKCRRVTRSILSAEVHAFSTCYDYALTLSHDLTQILSRKIPALLYTDSKSLFDTITKLSTVCEKRSLIDIAALREAYISGEQCNVAHISSQYLSRYIN